MYIGKNAFKSLLDDINYVNFLIVTSVTDNRCSINLSNKEEFTINTSLDTILEMVKESSTDYYIPNSEECIDEVCIINCKQITNIEDEVIVFKDEMKIDNFYENRAVLVDHYQLPLTILENTTYALH